MHTAAVSLFEGSSSDQMKFLKNQSPETTTRAAALSVIYCFFVKKCNEILFHLIHILRNKDYLVVPSVVVETAFLWYLEDDLLQWLQIWPYQFSQAEEASKRISAPGHFLFQQIVTVVLEDTCSETFSKIDRSIWKGSRTPL